MKSLILSLIILLFISGVKPEKQIVLMNKPSFDCDDLKSETVFLDDTIEVDSMILMSTQDGLPHSYSRRIISEVCMDKECRPLDVFVFWTVTGRYMGFQLPDGEFFSKTEHVPFKENDYYRLHELLADPMSILGNYSLKELVPVSDDEVDGISSATISDVKDYIVQDAVYTTYTLWHLVYGSTQNEIEKISKSRLTDDLLVKLLSGDNQYDILWGLNNIHEKLEWTEALISKMIQLSQSTQFFVADKAVGKFDAGLLIDEDVQLRLFSNFDRKSYFIKRKILKKLEQAPSLHPAIEKELVTKLSGLNGSLVKNILELLAVHQLNNPDTELIIAGLLNHDNRFIARKAFQFLENLLSENKKVNRMMKRYIRQN